MRVVVRQPEMFPPLYLVNRMVQADVMVVLDSAQFTRGNKHKHNAYALPGNLKLTVPIKHAGRISFGDSAIDTSHRWLRKHLAAIQHTYHPPEEKLSAIADMLGGERFLDVAMNILTDLTGALGRRAPEIVLSSSLKSQNTPGEPARWMVDICRELKATAYIGPRPDQKAHNDVTLFSSADLVYLAQDWRPTAMDARWSSLHFTLGHADVAQIFQPSVLPVN